MFTRGDVFLLVILLLIAGGIFFGQQRRNVNQRVVVFRDDSQLGSYPLSQDATIQIDTHCTFQIENRRVRMLHSDCPNQLCVKQGWSTGLPIICVPNHIIIRIQSGEEPLLITH
ncbi:MAG: NusG domain II-containing protein [Candidatus Cloacimonetes bacterium]|nr:NusG domain II-containing protein [Candidatus Cloacimonadota bacterium]